MKKKLLFTFLFLLCLPNAKSQDIDIAVDPVSVTKIENINGTVYQYIEGQKNLITKESFINSASRIEVTDGVIEISVNSQLITATAGADFNIIYNGVLLNLVSNQGVPIEVKTTSGHNLVLTSRAEVEIQKIGADIQIAVVSGRTLMSDLKGAEETKILNTSDIVTVTDLGVKQQPVKVKKDVKKRKAEFFKRFTKSEFETFGRYDINLRKFVFASNAFLNNRFISRPDHFVYFLTSSAEYDDNIYLTNTAKTDAYINRTSLGLSFRQGFERSDVYGRYTLGLLTYSKQQALNNAVHHDAEGGFKLKFPNEIAVSVQENYTATTMQETSEITFRTKRIANDLKIFAETPIVGKLGLRANLNLLNHDYTAAIYSGLDRKLVSFGGGLTYQVLPDTLMFLSYSYSDLDFKNISTHDNKYHTAMFFVEKKLSPELVGKIGAGAEFREYDTNLTLSSLTAKNKRDTLVFNGQVAWKPQGESRVILLAERKNIDSNINANELSRFYTSTLLDLSWLHKLNDFDFNLGFGWEFAEYLEQGSQNKKRDDRYSRFKAEVSWHINKWITAGAVYRFKSRSSNITANGYDGHAGGINFKIVY